MSDGRFIDTSIAVLEGEGAQQQVSAPEEQAPAEQPFHLVPSRSQALADEPTYYDKPVIKPPVWMWTIPLYFYVGGTAGASMAMGLAAQAFGGKRLRAFEERCRWVGAIGGGIGSALLISDLGRKKRFLLMLRVFRPTSPMSVGSWVLALATPLSAGSALLTFSKGRLREVGNTAGFAAGILGLPLATYTGLLIANTAVPVWQQSRRALPLLFGASSVSGMAALFDLMPLGDREREIVRIFGSLGRVLEITATFALETDAAEVERVAKPLRSGATGVLWRASQILTVSSLVIAALPGHGRARRTIGGVLGTLGAISLRFAVFYAGKRSALDPRATFRQQRAGLGAAEVTSGK